MATLGGIDLGILDSEDQTKDSNLFNQPLPYSDSDDSLLMDLFGTGRSIVLSGVKKSTSRSDLQTFVADIESIQNGQQTGSTYIGELITASKTVLIQSFNWRWVAGDVQRVHYTITLLEGQPI